jgi:CBS domain-containing protein
MTTVKTIIDKKSNTIFSVSTTEPVENVLKVMRDFRVRAVLVIDDGVLMGIVSQGDCAIKVLLPNDDPRTTSIRKIMTPNPLTVRPDNTLEDCMGIMMQKHFRHLPVVENDKVVGVVSIGDIVKNIIEQQGHQIKYLETYIKGHGA